MFTSLFINKSDYLMPVKNHDVHDAWLKSLDWWGDKLKRHTYFILFWALFPMTSLTCWPYWMENTGLSFLLQSFLEWKMKIKLYFAENVENDECLLISDC